MITKGRPENATTGFRRNWWSFSYLRTAPSRLRIAWPDKAGRKCRVWKKLGF